jgi:hypothetical protein
LWLLRGLLRLLLQLQASASQQLLASQLAEVKAHSSALLQQKGAKLAALEAALADTQRQLQQAQAAAAEAAAAAAAGGACGQQGSAWRPASPVAAAGLQHVVQQQGGSRPGSAAAVVRPVSPLAGCTQQQQQGWLVSGTAYITQQHCQADLALAGALLEHSSSSSTSLQRRCSTPAGTAAAAAGRINSRPGSAALGGSPTGKLGGTHKQQQGWAADASSSLLSGAACSQSALEKLKPQIEQQLQLELRQKATAMLAPAAAAAAAAVAEGSCSASGGDAAVLAQYACSLQEQLEG